MKRNSQHGFTLIELMVVVAIIAILSGMIISINKRTYGASASAIADQLVSNATTAKMRAVSTRRWHRLTIRSSSAQLWQATTTGIGTPTAWALVQNTNFGGGTTVWNCGTTVYATSGSASVTQNASLSFNLDFSPDGSSTGATCFITDDQAKKKWRVIVYKATGGAYDRELW
jgi:prepilin-type N-terminal cleavage/methylation domain-containing protein